MSYTFLQEQGEESSADTFSDIPAYVLSRLNLIADESYSSGNEMESCQSSQSGMMSLLLMESLGEEKSMSFVEDSHAKTSVARGGELEFKENDLGCGQKWPESLAKYDQNTSSWKTAQCLLFEDSAESLETFPNWGIMLNGELWELPTPNFLTEENEYGSWVPTPVTSMWRGAAKKRYYGSQDYKASFPMEWIRTSKDCEQYLNPAYAEAIMGFPIKWTDLNPLEMPKFQSWLQQHLDFFHNQ